MASESVQIGRARHRRILILLNVGCAKYVRALIDKYVKDLRPPLNLDEFLKHNKDKIESNKKLNYRERNLLYPPINGSSDISKWDLTLLTMIFLNHCNPTLYSRLKMDMRMLTDRRNTLSHSATHTLSEEEYSTLLDEIKVISKKCLKKISNKELTDEVNACLDNDLEFGLDRLKQLTNELHEKCAKSDQDNTDQKQILSEILDILKQLFPEDTATSIPDIKLKLDVKNCAKEKEIYICQKVKEYMEAECEDIPDDFKQVVQRSMMKLLQNDIEFVSAENKCLIITLRCYSVRGLLNLWLEYTKDSVDIFKPLQEYLRTIEGYENVQVQSEILESDIWGWLHTIDRNMFNEHKSATETDIVKCDALESTISKSRIPQLPYTISHDGNDSFVKIDVQVDSFHHMKHILDVCESGALSNRLEYIATALKEHLKIEDLSIDLSVDAYATLELIKERYLSRIVKRKDPDEKMVHGSSLQNVGPREGNRDGRFQLILYQERMCLFGFLSYPQAPLATVTPTESIRDSAYETNDVQSNRSFLSITNQKDAQSPLTTVTPTESVRDSAYETSDLQSIYSLPSVSDQKDALSILTTDTPTDSEGETEYDTIDIKSICSLHSIIIDKKDAYTHNEHELSSRLYDVLNVVGGTGEQRSLDIYIIQEMMLKISEHLAEKKVTSYIFGSSNEGTTTPGMNSNIDLLYCSNAHVVEKIGHSSDLHSFLIIRDKLTPAGYVKLQLVYNGIPQTVYKRKRDQEYAECDIKGRICLKHIKFLEEYMNFDERNCPADSLIGFSMDSYFTHKSTNIPAFASEWIDRKRINGWPSKHLLNKLSTMGCFFVGIGHPASIERSIEWRISFSLQERELIFSMNDLQHKCYVMLKIIKKNSIEPNVGTSISSYHLKTCLFHVIENTKSSFWRRQNLIKCVMLCIRVLLRWVYKGYCPNYFIKEDNVFDTDIFKRQKLNLIDQLHKLLSGGYAFLFHIKIDFIGDILKHGTSYRLMGEMVEYRFRKRFNIIKRVLNIRNKLCCNANNCHTSIMYSNSIFSKVFQNVSMRDKLTQNALSNSVQFIQLQLAQSYFSQGFKSNAAEDKFELLQRAGYYLKEGRSGNIISSALLKATVLFKLEHYERCIHILDQLELIFYLKSLSICSCHGQPLYCFNEHARQLRTIPMSHILARLSTCMVFLRSDMPITLLPLQFEMFRSINTPPGSRHNTYDKWFDLAVVDSIVYLHFMQYMVNTKLNRQNHKHLAIYKLESKVRTEDSLGHRETGYNLLGWIHFQEGWKRLGVNYFRKSLTIQPHHNAAKFHMLKIFTD